MHQEGVSARRCTVHQGKRGTATRWECAARRGAPMGQGRGEVRPPMHRTPGARRDPSARRAGRELVGTPRLGRGPDRHPRAGAACLRTRPRAAGPLGPAHHAPRPARRCPAGRAGGVSGRYTVYLGTPGGLPGTATTAPPASVRGPGVGSNTEATRTTRAVGRSGGRGWGGCQPGGD